MTQTSQVTIPSELNTYIAILHDIIAAYHERLSQAASPDVAAHFLATIADKQVRYLGLDKDSDPKKALETFLQNIGMKHQTFKIGDYKTVTRLECPYANVVHPRITAAHPICPISVLALATERITNKKLLIASNHLTPTGAEYTIAPCDPT